MRKDKLTELREMRAKAKLGGGEALHLADQHAKGKLTARERIEYAAGQRHLPGVGPPRHAQRAATSAWRARNSPATAW